MENMIIAFNCVVPIFIWLMVGYAAKRAEVIPQEIYPQINKFNFHVLLMILLFNSTYHADFQTSFSPALIAYVMAALTGLTVLGMVVTRGMKDQRRRGAYVQALYRCNLASVGVALMKNLSDAEGTAMMAIVVAFAAPLLNVLAVVALELCRGEKVPMDKLLGNILKNPIIIGAFAGVACNLVGLRLPSSVDSALTSLGTAGMVLSLVVLGATLEFSQMAKSIVPIAIGTFARLVAAPLICVPLAALLGFRGNAIAVVLLATATPLATNAFIMAQVYDSDYELSAQHVMSTSLLSCFTLFVWIVALKSIGIM